MEKETVEYNELIATRVKGQGDTWILVEDKNKVIHRSLTDALEAWFEKNQIKAEFRLSPLDSKLYVIRNEEKEIQPEPVKRFNIYGDPQ
jgi:putative aminopeptidase FrvX